jgi:hypothetical protein
VVFPEAGLTGLINNDDPAHDLPLGREISGAVTDRLAPLARERQLWLAKRRASSSLAHMGSSPRAVLPPQSPFLFRMASSILSPS